ncbi:hypothetical protein CC80DRAFT_12641 [Byssothecium circinans]|uniref:Uncharacterized protein n=1 Tax=Byssothecium circinans TaxID=147558 RepID=A0A6A5UJ10_9PLEO|nr:hypothetical protein CC80DRAFT_12641 [Byssothecium circinans]
MCHRRTPTPAAAAVAVAVAVVVVVDDVLDRSVGATVVVGVFGAVVVTVVVGGEEGRGRSLLLCGCGCGRGRGGLGRINSRFVCLFVIGSIRIRSRGIYLGVLSVFVEVVTMIVMMLLGRYRV